MEGHGLAAAVSRAHMRVVHHRQGHNASAGLMSKGRHNLLSECPQWLCILQSTKRRLHVVQGQTAPRSVHPGETPRTSCHDHARQARHSLRQLQRQQARSR